MKKFLSLLLSLCLLLGTLPLQVSAQSAYGPHCMDGLAGLLFSMPSA